MNRPTLVLLAALVLATAASVYFLVLPPLKAPPPEPPEPTVPAAQPFEAIIDKTLAGYNAHDAGMLFADFSRNALPAPTDATHRALFEGYYHAKFGAFQSRKLNFRESEILPDRALLVWYATFSHAKPVKLSANFITEEGRAKIVQLRFERPEVAQ